MTVDSHAHKIKTNPKGEGGGGTQKPRDGTGAQMTYSKALEEN